MRKDGDFSALCGSWHRGSLPAAPGTGVPALLSGLHSRSQDVKERPPLRPARCRSAPFTPSRRCPPRGCPSVAVTPAEAPPPEPEERPGPSRLGEDGGCACGERPGAPTEPPPPTRARGAPAPSARRHPAQPRALTRPRSRPRAHPLGAARAAALGSSSASPPSWRAPAPASGPSGPRRAPRPPRAPAQVGRRRTAGTDPSPPDGTAASDGGPGAARCGGTGATRGVSGKGETPARPTDPTLFCLAARAWCQVAQKFTGGIGNKLCGKGRAAGPRGSVGCASGRGGGPGAAALSARPRVVVKRCCTETPRSPRIPAPGQPLGQRSRGRPALPAPATRSPAAAGEPTSTTRSCTQQVTALRGGPGAAAAPDTAVPRGTEPRTAARPLGVQNKRAPKPNKNENPELWSPRVARCEEERPSLCGPCGGDGGLRGGGTLLKLAVTSPFSRAPRPALLRDSAAAALPGARHRAASELGTAGTGLHRTRMAGQGLRAAAIFLFTSFPFLPEIRFPFFPRSPAVSRCLRN